MPGRHGRRAAPPIRARGKAPATARRISAVTSAGMFIMAVLVGIIVEHSMAPHLGVGYRVPPAAASHGRKPRAAAIPRTAPGVHRSGHAPAVKHPIASVASLPGAVRLTMMADRGPAAAAAFGGLPGTQPSVDLLRHNGSFVFGTAAIGVPPGVAAMPETALFLARASGGTWHVALDGTSGFAQMLLQVPGQMIPAAEKQLLAHYNAVRQAAAASPGRTGGQAGGTGGQAGGTGGQTGGTGGQAGGTGGQAGGQPPAAPTPWAGGEPSAPGSAGGKPSRAGSAGSEPSRAGPVGGEPSAPGPAASSAPASTAAAGTQTGLALPWKVGQSWTMIPTPGQRPAGADPLAQASFTGGDGRVLSAGSGRLYRFCASRGAPGPGDALIEVIHSDGSVTGYYQIDHETRVRDGSPIPQGAYLGRTGTSLACGGSAGRPEAEFSLLRMDGRGLDRAVIGGWTFRETLQPFRVWAQRGSKQVVAGSPLRNLGPLVDRGNPQPRLPGPRHHR